ncbi:hypothetical protein FC093_21640 [Ilyomonas limi]|uniref:Transposase n=1 Tax=Ilyomonas limi TaxID=2575867 RepID=A0A4U3KR95_9BACT|nr:hypothetical protein [Ilyomonas limi]TKK64858.1 hypothetical protein FC093_21640 [Ilyomonas limi]
MSYKKMMKWQRKHPKGTRQIVIMHTESGFQTSAAFMEKYFKHRQQCDVENKEPLDCESYYRSTLR